MMTNHVNNVWTLNEFQATILPAMQFPKISVKEL